MAEEALFPFNGYKLYITFHKQMNRYMAQLVKTEKDRITMSYARYLICVKLGYILSQEFEVDHKDNDKTNDDVSNLQILTKEDNRLKEYYNYIINKQICYGYICACCGTSFIITEGERNKRIKQGNENSLVFCSIICSRKVPKGFIKA